MTKEEFKKIDEAEIIYKYVEKQPFKKKLDFTNFDLLLAFNFILLIAVISVGIK